MLWVVGESHRTALIRCPGELEEESRRHIYYEWYKPDWHEHFESPLPTFDRYVESPTPMALLRVLLKVLHNFLPLCLNHRWFPQLFFREINIHTSSPPTIAMMVLEGTLSRHLHRRLSTPGYVDFLVIIILSFLMLYFLKLLLQLSAKWKM